MTSSCPIDGAERKVIAREPDAVQYRCPFCGTYSEERHTPTHLLPKDER